MYTLTYFRNKTKTWIKKSTYEEIIPLIKEMKKLNPESWFLTNPGGVRINEG